MRRSSWLWSVPVVAIVVASPVHAGGLLTTAPYLGSFVRSGFATCVAANVGGRTADVTITLLDTNGNVLVGPDTFTVPPRTTRSSTSVNLANQSPALCQFEVGSSRSWRGSMFINPDGGIDGTDVVVVPAQ